MQAIENSVQENDQATAAKAVMLAENYIENALYSILKGAADGEKIRQFNPDLNEDWSCTFSISRHHASLSAMGHTFDPLVTDGRLIERRQFDNLAKHHKGIDSSIVINLSKLISRFQLPTPEKRADYATPVKEFVKNMFNSIDSKHITREEAVQTMGLSDFIKARSDPDGNL